KPTPPPSPHAVARWPGEYKQSPSPPHRGGEGRVRGPGSSYRLPYTPDSARKSPQWADCGWGLGGQHGYACENQTHSTPLTLPSPPCGGRGATFWAAGALG